LGCRELLTPDTGYDLGKDKQGKGIKHAAQNFAVVRKIALNLVKKDTAKESLVCKRIKAVWNKEFLIRLLKI
jgi:hypothetical protein